MQIAQTSSSEVPVLTVAEIHALADKLSEAQATAKQLQLHCEQIGEELNRSIEAFNVAQKPGNTWLRPVVITAEAILHLAVCLGLVTLTAYIASTSQSLFEVIVRGAGVVLAGTLLLAGLEKWRKAVFYPFCMRKGFATTHTFWQIYPKA